ncbi:MAG TPA: hypothetical protein VHH15_03775 [Actinophytocola sp.]|nr:hypothetical protein [Actinophytocola sp.]
MRGAIADAAGGLKLIAPNAGGALALLAEKLDMAGCAPTAPR